MTRYLFSYLVISLGLFSLALSKRPPQNPLPVYEIGKTKGFSYQCLDCSVDEQGRLARAQGIIFMCMSMDEFKSDLESFKRIEQDNGIKDIASFIRDNGINGIQVRFYWPRWYQSKNVVGYTSANDPVIYLNKAFRGKSWNDWAEASNLFHETMHKIGFEHDFKATERRPYSVPYLANRVIEKCEARFASANKN